MSAPTFERLYRLLRSDVYRFGYAAGWFGRYGGEDIHPTAQQREVLDQINVTQGRPYFGAVKSGQGVGKTNLESLVACWRAFRSYGAPTYVTAPTMRQVKDVFLKEARRMLERGDPLITSMFDVQATRIVINGMKDWGVVGFAATRAENAQGLHHPNMSFVVDEASGVDSAIFETIFGTLTQKRSDGTAGDRFFLACGNPNSRDCEFFKFFTSMRGRFYTHTFSALDSPIVDPDNIDRIREQYGEDSDVWRIRVLGEFPLQDPRCVMNSDDLEACARNDMVKCVADRRILSMMPTDMEARQFGLDFARYGGDKNVLYRRSGLAVVEGMAMSRTEPSILVARAFEMQKRAGWSDDETTFVCDADGMGQGVMHIFYNRNKRVHEFHNAGRAYHSDTYYDAMTEAMFELARLVKARAIHIPKDPDLIRELSTRQYATADGKLGGGRLKLESKEQFTKRTGEASPDKGDACAMAFYPYTYGRAAVARRQARGRTASNRKAAAR